MLYEVITEFSDDQILSDASVLARIRQAIESHNDRARGSSTRIFRAIVLAAPPSVDANEITDKGYINQAGVLAHRADLVAALYSDSPPQGTMEF